MFFSRFLCLLQFSIVAITKEGKRRIILHSCSRHGYQENHGIRPFTLAVSIRLMTVALAFSPPSISWNKKFFSSNPSCYSYLCGDEMIFKFPCHKMSFPNVSYYRKEKR